MSKTTEEAVQILRDRAEFGVRKYGTSMDRNDLTGADWCQHAIEEMLDGAQYLIRVKQDFEAKNKRIAELENQWISVDDRLPYSSQNGGVLAINDSGIIFLATSKDGWWPLVGAINMTHWMPLPATPKALKKQDDV